jgi:hypothetical protein
MMVCYSKSEWAYDAAGCYPSTIESGQCLLLGETSLTLFPATLGPGRTKPSPKTQVGHLWLARIACAVTSDHAFNLAYIPGKLNLFLRHLFKKG